jgi:IclR family transcriptional regulator, acetate operon repressor
MGDVADEARRTREPVTRAMQVLSCMVEAGGRRCGVRDLAAAMEVPPSSAYRLLKLLGNASMVSRDEEGTYSLSLEFYRLAWQATSGHQLRTAALPHLRKLVEEINETAVLGVYDAEREQMVYAAIVEAQQEFRYVAEVNEWRPMTDGSSGMAITAFLPDEVRRRIAEREVGESPYGSLENLEREFALIRKQGYAFYRRKRQPSMVGVTAPIRDAERSVSACVFVGLPAERYREVDQASFVRSIRATAGRISREIGGAPDPDPR